MRKFTINGEAAGRGRVVLQPHARDATRWQSKHTSKQREYKSSMPHDTNNQHRCVSRRQWEAMRTLPLSEGMRLIGGIGVRVLHINSAAAHRRAAKK